MSSDETDPVAVEVVRGGLVESVHRARAVVTGPDGRILWALGDATAPMYPRSASKPFQAVALLRHGLELEGEHLALAGASHSGESFHVDGVRRILAGAGLGEEVLQNVPDLPLEDQARIEWLRAGRGPERVAMNCSGKHAAMLATCVANGWPTEPYLDAASPVQHVIADTIAELVGERLAEPTVDGCGAPLFACSLAGLARGFGRLAAATDGAERAVADAFGRYPEWASGTRRDEAALHRALPGVVAKAGAEAVYAVGLPDGRGVALKIADGHPRARPVLMAALLRAMGFEHPVLAEQAAPAVLGHGRAVGETRTVSRALNGLATGC